MKRVVVVIVFLLFSVNALAGLPRIVEAGAGANGAGYFKVQSTGQVFVPRGVNYVRESGGLHNLFAPAVYNTAQVDAAFNQLEFDDYNVVRVFIENWPVNNASVGLPMTEGGLNAAYLNNVADFITRASNHNIYVMLTLPYFPHNNHYLGIANSAVTDPGYYGTGINYNSFHMNLGHVLAKEEYVKDFVTAIKNRIGASNLSNIFAYGLENELFFADNSFPFNQSSGMIPTLNGLSYNMAVTADRQQAADASAVEYAIRSTNALKSIDSSAMAAIGVFTYRAIGLPSGPDGIWPGTTSDWRRPGRPASLTTFSNIDFIDIHNYPEGAYSLSADLASSEYSLVIGPVLMGEFGATKTQYATVSSAAFGMRDLQVDSCNNFNTAGWLFWTFDTTSQPNFYNLMQNGGSINGQLAPIARPDPCSP